MNNTDDYFFSESHIWLEEQGDGIFTLGITEHAQDSLGDIVFIELPAEGQQFAAGEGCAVIESVKSASDVIMPIHGEIIAINQQLVEMPELINQEPFNNGWIVRFRSEAPYEEIAAELMSAADYEAFLDQ
ncbi:glycine cleavage system protein GcvH [Methylophaga nitratireducenticrescens]|uniref:Glycine cleavage system H protein n=1 Tax=Methylophaga nitratireducenticrescens TaxID=754476 RepID=I1XLS5_METNJ|nr:glycine cleavage system protein GcvH [Methylophaga nitratireducenticrescens]AFI85344.1 glycine cleavage system protein H [Methylophaga nitratireducenticrescens]AUZ85110.1 glycine cleavage system protein H [Methylophaga nitratireducenticrescens]